MSDKFEVYCHGCDFPRLMDYPYYYVPLECKECYLKIAEEDFKKCLNCNRCHSSVCQPCEKKLFE